MARYVALLRGVSPMNAKMPELKKCFEQAGFTNVKTVLASGNVVFDARAAALATLERRVEAAQAKHLDRTFPTIVRSVESLQALLAADRFLAHELPANAKRVVTFFRSDPVARLATPVVVEGATILEVVAREAFTFYTPHPKGPVFMVLIEKTFGKEQTTRTWGTIEKLARA